MCCYFFNHCIERAFTIVGGQEVDLIQPEPSVADSLKNISWEKNRILPIEEVYKEKPINLLLIDML